MSDKFIGNAMLTTAVCTTLGKMAPEVVGGKGELPDVRIFIGVGFTFFVLSTMDDYAPEVAGPLAFAIAGTAFSIYAVPIITKLLGAEPKGKTNEG